MDLVLIFLHNMLDWTSMMTRKHFWRLIFGICEKYEVNYIQLMGAKITIEYPFWPVRAFKHCFRLPELVLFSFTPQNTTFGTNSMSL